MKTRSNTPNCKLPQNKQVEQIVLGMLMLESTAINEVDMILSPEVFYYPAHAVIYQAIHDLEDYKG